jgi:hypothetical protein
VYLLNHDFEFPYLLLEFDVLGASGARPAIQNDASLRSENLHVASTAQSCHFLVTESQAGEAVENDRWIWFLVANVNAEKVKSVCVSG